MQGPATICCSIKMVNVKFSVFADGLNYNQHRPRIVLKLSLSLPNFASQQQKISCCDSFSILSQRYPLCSSPAPADVWMSSVLQNLVYIAMIGSINCHHCCSMNESWCTDYNPLSLLSLLLATWSVCRSGAGSHHGHAIPLLRATHLMTTLQGFKHHPTQKYPAPHRLPSHGGVVKFGTTLGH